MGDAGEGLIDAEGRIQERMEELERERKQLAEDEKTLMHQMHRNLLTFLFT